MKPQYPDFRSAILGGITATATLTALMYAAPLVGFPAIDMPSAIGGFLGRPALMFTGRWWMGMAVFLLVGTVLSPLLFSYITQILYGKQWLRGAEWGVLLWIFGAVCVMVHLGLCSIRHSPLTRT